MWLISSNFGKVHINLLCFTIGGAENLAEFLGCSVAQLGYSVAQ